MMLYTNFLFLCIFVCKNVWSANILYVTPVASPSHHIWNKALALGLVKNGHNITMLTHEIDKKVPRNFTIITMEGVYEQLKSQLDYQDLANINTFMLIPILYDYFAFLVCEFDFNSPGMQRLLNYPKDYKFDLIIYDITLARCMYPLTDRFGNPPAIGVTPFLLPPPLSYAFGNHLYTSYVPYYITAYTNKMNLFERVMNFIYTYTEILYRNYVYLPREERLIKEKFKYMKSSIDELERRVSLLLFNADFVMDYPQALPPNIIPVGGLPDLPKDIEKIINDSKDGVILFSLGTNVRSDQLSLETKRALLNAFSKIHQTVFWKFESENLENKPKNVIIRKWLPQNDILGHPKTKLFINHGGALSIQEAVYHGVPMVGIPHFYDQHVNVRKLEVKGAAVYLSKDNLTTDSVYDAITTALNSASIKMKELSIKYHDQPQGALERGIFWVEYLLRHGDADHLVSPARDMPSYQTTNLDVMLISAVSLVLLYSFVMFLMSFLNIFYSVNERKKKN